MKHHHVWLWEIQVEDRPDHLPELGQRVPRDRQARGQPELARDLGRLGRGGLAVEVVLVERV